MAGQAEQQRAAVEREGREAREEREREAWQLKEDHSRAMEEMRRRHSVSVCTFFRSAHWTSSFSVQ